jgi:hypothetical protein
VEPTSVAQSVVVGAIGAIASADDEAADGYYLVEFTSLPYTDQCAGGTLQCDVNWLNPFPRARKRFTKSAAKETFDLVNVVSTGVVMLPISPSNMPPKRVHKTAERNEALKISEDSHNFILDEIIRRERLEYDPSRVSVGDEDNEEYQGGSCARAPLRNYTKPFCDITTDILSHPLIQFSSRRQEMDK